jgi:hypothetical protein
MSAKRVALATFAKKTFAFPLARAAGITIVTRQALLTAAVASKHANDRVGSHTELLVGLYNIIRGKQRKKW